MQLPKQLKEFLLFTYSLSSLEQKVKVKVLRNLQGYQNKKGKVYTHQGLIQQHEAEKIGSNAILVPAQKAIFFSTFFDNYKVPYKYKEVFTK